MRISELSAATNEHPHTLRYYEAEGLLPTPRCTPSGYRDYDRRAIDQVHLVRALQHACLTLADIASLVHISQSPGPISPNDAGFVTFAKSCIDHQLDTLHRMRAHLTYIASVQHESNG